MPSKSLYRCAAVVALIAGVLVMGGCGSSHSSSSATDQAASGPTSTSTPSGTTSSRTTHDKASTNHGKASTPSGTQSSPAGSSSTGSGAPSTGSGTPAAAGPLCPNGATACVSQNPAATVVGPKVVSVNLVQSMTRTNPKLKQVNLTCRATPSYPVICPLSAIVTAKNKATTVKGEVRVMGVDTVTHTYAYSVFYEPVPGH